MKLSSIIALTATLAIVPSFSQAEAEGAGSVLPEPEVTEGSLILALPALKGAPARQTPAPGADSSTAVTMFRDLPSIHGQYSVGGTTLLPYVGAGFGSGYTTERDRSLQGGSSIQTDSGLRSLFGQSITPNEFQMGIRIPF